jgi:3-oxoacyl-[acyl-carrier protein] reductase
MENAARPTALVTGSSRGIGAAIASAIEARGFRVIRHGTRIEGTDCVAADLGDAGETALLWDRAVDMAGGRIDVLVNNAGVFEASPIDNTDAYWLAEWERCLRINLTSAAQLSRLAVRQWLKEPRDPVAGRLVNIASRAAYRGDSPDHWHYAAAKAGEVAMTKTIARAYAGHGILAFAICPGFTDSSQEGSGDYLASRGGPGLLADIPLGRVAEPAEIAAIAAFCATDAPPSMTGAVLDANGASYVR